jgi:sensor histidine kinase YesM
MIFVGILISLLLKYITKVNQPAHNIFYDFIASILITILVWEGNLRIDHWMNKNFPWVIKPGKRILVHLPVSMFFSASVIYLSMLSYNTYVCNLPAITRDAFMKTSVIIGIMVSIILLSIEIGMQFFKNWRTSLVEVEKYKTESVQAQLQNLKNQINPHFLFNNLSVLSSLVYKDQDKAVDFINQLSKVYRYLLDNRNIELISLENELTFVKSYNYLLQIRFDKNILFNVHVDGEYLNKLIPPMALQMLIENAVKHNEISNEQALNINISVINHYLAISNNLQLRSNQELSSKTGLQNIKDRYKHFTDKEIEIIETNHSFTVKIPLLN